MIIVAPLYNFCSPDFCRFTFRESRPPDLDCRSLCTRCSPGLRSVYPSLQAANVICDLACISGCLCPFLQQRWPVLVPSSAAAHVLVFNLNCPRSCGQPRQLAFSTAAAASVFVLASCSSSSCSLQQQLLVCAAASAICDSACCSGCPFSLLQQQLPSLVPSTAAALVLVLNINVSRLCVQPCQLAISSAAAASVSLACCSSSSCSLQQQLLVCAAANAICDSACISGCPCPFLQQRWPVLVPSSAAAHGLARNINSPRPCIQPRQLASSSAAAASVSVLACCYLATKFLCLVVVWAAVASALCCVPVRVTVRLFQPLFARLLVVRAAVASALCCAFVSVIVRLLLLLFAWLLIVRAAVASALCRVPVTSVSVIVRLLQLLCWWLLVVRAALASALCCVFVFVSVIMRLRLLWFVWLLIVRAAVASSLCQQLFLALFLLPLVGVSGFGTSRCRSASCLRSHLLLFSLPGPFFLSSFVMSLRVVRSSGLWRSLKNPFSVDFSCPCVASFLLPPFRACVPRMLHSFLRTFAAACVLALLSEVAPPPVSLSRSLLWCSRCVHLLSGGRFKSLLCRFHVFMRGFPLLPFSSLLSDVAPLPVSPFQSPLWCSRYVHLLSGGRSKSPLCRFHFFMRGFLLLPFSSLLSDVGPLPVSPSQSSLWCSRCVHLLSGGLLKSPLCRFHFFMRGFLFFSFSFISRCSVVVAWVPVGTAVCAVAVPLVVPFSVPLFCSLLWCSPRVHLLSGGSFKPLLCRFQFFLRGSSPLLDVCPVCNGWHRCIPCTLCRVLFRVSLFSFSLLCRVFRGSFSNFPFTVWRLGCLGVNPY